MIDKSETKQTKKKKKREKQIMIKFASCVM